MYDLGKVSSILILWEIGPDKYLKYRSSTYQKNPVRQRKVYLHDEN